MESQDRVPYFSHYRFMRKTPEEGRQGVSINDSTSTYVERKPYLDYKTIEGYFVDDLDQFR